MSLIFFTATPVQRAQWKEEPWSGYGAGIQNAGEEGKPHSREYSSS